MTDSTTHKDSQDETHFGYQTVQTDDKTGLVKGVFDSVASRYDIMNDVMSWGMHRFWKRFAIRCCQIRPHHHVLDLAGGTGDLTRRILPYLGPDGRMVLSDINQAMLDQAKRALLDAGVWHRVECCQANAEALPFNDGEFDRVIIAFGLRNVTHKDQALREMRRVLRPGGKAVVLEFSQPQLPGLGRLYDLYSFKVLPWLGEQIANDAASYQYLAESIRMHPDQETLKTLMQEAGFDAVDFHQLLGGVVAVHSGLKY